MNKRMKRKKSKKRRCDVGEKKHTEQTKTFHMPEVISGEIQPLSDESGDDMGDYFSLTKEGRRWLVDGELDEEKFSGLFIDSLGSTKEVKQRNKAEEEKEKEKEEDCVLEETNPPDLKSDDIKAKRKELIKYLEKKLRKLSVVKDKKKRRDALVNYYMSLHRPKFRLYSRVIFQLAKYHVKKGYDEEILDELWSIQRDMIKVRRFQVCENCLYPDSLMVCARCKSVLYCCKTCQVVHWVKEHKDDCGKNL